MATSSSGPGPGCITDAVSVDVRPDVLSYGALETLRSCTVAVQAEMPCARVDAVTANRSRCGLLERHPQWGIGADLTMARHESPRSGVEYVNFCESLVPQPPFTLQSLEYGAINMVEAQITDRETRHLAAAGRAEIDVSHVYTFPAPRHRG